MIMRSLAITAVLLAVLPAAAASAPAPRFEGRACKPPRGHRIADCRLAKHGTPDLSRSAFHALRDQEVTISARIDSLAPNPAAEGRREWPLVDSLAQPMGRLRASDTGRFELVALNGSAFYATRVNIRGHGCAASADQSARFALFQIIAGKARAGGTQGFVDSAALDQTSDSGRAALAAFVQQRGGGTGCGPAGHEAGRVRSLANPRVGASAHARLSNGTLNGVTEYDAKPEFGNVVYFMSNTTAVKAGGITRGMVRVGTPYAKVDSFTYCDPSSDATLTWRYWSIRTGVAARPRLYGWIPGRCPAVLRGRAPM
jgi:hypothetical protein